CKRVGGVVTGDADGVLGLGVVGLELVVVERPVDHIRTLDRPELGTGAEVDLAESRQLPVGVEAAPSDGGWKVVHVPGEDPVPVVRGAPERAGLEQRVGAEEVPLQGLDLVAADLAGPLERRARAAAAVATLLPGR